MEIHITDTYALATLAIIVGIPRIARAISEWAQTRDLTNLGRQAIIVCEGILAAAIPPGKKAKQPQD